MIAPAASAEERRIELYNIHTKNELSVVYKKDGAYVPVALKKLNHFMRDWRRDASIKMDPELFDIIWEIHRELGSKKPVHLISGYRSPKTNAMLRKTRGGQAKKSKHMTGEAADIHFPDVSAKKLRNSALVREQGGVGYYPTSAIPFVHVDTGRVRHWPRLPRQELAILFPSGKSRHVPSDGKPLRKKDFQIALARLQKKGGDLPIAVRRKLENDGQGRIILAKLSPQDVPVPSPAPELPARMVYASFNPLDGLAGALQGRNKSESKPLVRTSVKNASEAGGRQDLDRSFRPGRNAGPSNLVPQDQIASAPEYDDDHPDELYYQPFPILPFMADTSVAAMDLHGGAEPLSLKQVHLFFGESQHMLVTQFQPGLQYAQLFWAQRFRGPAVNTQIKRMVRNVPPHQAVQTAQGPMRTASRR